MNNKKHIFEKKKKHNRKYDYPLSKIEYTIYKKYRISYLKAISILNENGGQIEKMSGNNDIEQYTTFLEFFFEKLRKCENLDEIKDEIEKIEVEKGKDRQYFYKDILSRDIDNLYPERETTLRYRKMRQSLMQSKNLRDARNNRK